MMLFPLLSTTIFSACLLGYLFYAVRGNLASMGPLSAGVLAGLLFALIHALFMSRYLRNYRKLLPTPGFLRKELLVFAILTIGVIFLTAELCRSIDDTTALRFEGGVFTFAIVLAFQSAVNIIAAMQQTLQGYLERWSGGADETEHPPP